jgi:hypothetical protein
MAGTMQPIPFSSSIPYQQKETDVTDEFESLKPEHRQAALQLRDVLYAIDSTRVTIRDGVVNAATLIALQVVEHGLAKDMQDFRDAAAALSAIHARMLAAIAAQRQQHEQDA